MPKIKLIHEFRDQSLLEQALRHRSASAPHNERLEFLGDSLLNCVIAQELFNRYPKVDEGALTRARAELVRESALAQVGADIGISEHLILGPGEMKAGGHRRASIIADAVEAVLGAVFIDSAQDMKAAQRFVLHYWATQLDSMPSPAKIEKDAKTRLQELLQGRSLDLPLYEMIGESGPDHARIFEVSCSIPKFNIETRATGTSRRAAEQIAADMALTRLLERL